ncbi:MAG: c-type cytochrome [Acidobacteriota bacterium]
MHTSRWAFAFAYGALALSVAGAHGQTSQNGAPPAPTNLQVLTADVNLPKVMASFNAALAVQCTYCHVANNFSSDANSKKDVARKMLRLLQQVNLHFPDAGNDFVNSRYLPFPEGKQYVSCYSCHRGSAIPVTTIPNWHGPDRAPEPGVVPGNRGAGGGRGRGAAAAPGGDAPARGAGAAATDAAAVPATRGNQMHKNMVFLPVDTTTNLVMPAFRAAIGVECNFCHVAGAKMELGHANDRESDLNPKKLIARSMIGMMQEINTTLFPGENVDVVLTASSVPPQGTHYVTCYTCHRGSRTPLTEPAPVAAR